MTTDDLALIDNKILELVNDKSDYSFSILKDKVEKILKTTNIFLIENELDTKAVDLYLKNVITQRNNIKKQQEKQKVDESKETKYSLIEAICKKCEFSTQEELIKKIEELELKTNKELVDIYNSF